MKVKKIRAIVRVSPRGDLTCHQAGITPFPDYKKNWQILSTWKSNRPITDLKDYAYRRLVHLYGL